MTAKEELLDCIQRMTKDEWEMLMVDDTLGEDIIELLTLIGRQNGWLSANDIRELENLDRIPTEEGGDLYLINGNMRPLDRAGAFANTTEKEDTDSDESTEEVLAVEESGGRRRSRSPGA